MACTIDESALPILTGCPGPNELVVVGNAVGGLDANGNYTIGYGRRSIGGLINCFLSNLVFVPLQFTIGSAGSPINSGQSSLTIAQAAVIIDSVFITLDGSEMDRNDSTQISYSVIYNSNNIIINFNQGVNNGQTYIIHYVYANLTSSTQPPIITGFNTGHSTQSGDGVSLTFAIPHGLGVVPGWIDVGAGSNDAIGISTYTADSVNIYVSYSASPPVGINNLLFYWAAKI